MRKIMLENYSKNDELKFKELSPEEKQQRGILGRLYGPIASVVKATRNGRKYTEALWEKVFANPIVKEMYAQGGVPGELDHPDEREETCSEKIAIMMPEPPTKDTKGNLIGYFDIIDTPCGRIAYALAKYGFNLGISSRGCGETFTDLDGQETVDEDTYSFNAFDLVLLPACEGARLQLAESLDTRNAKFTAEINTLLESSDSRSKKIITETLENLKLIDNTSSETKDEEPEQVEASVADSDGTDLVNELQESLKEVKNLQQKVFTLQEKLSVSYTKEIRQEEEITTLKDTVRRLAESIRRAKVASEQLEATKVQLAEQTHLAAQNASIAEAYKKKFATVTRSKGNLQESLSSKESLVESLTNQVSALSGNLADARKEQERLTESYEQRISELKTDAEIRNSQYSKKMAQAKKLAENYRKTAKLAVDKYIESKAINLGVNAKDIKCRLSENCSFDDIDRICESLRTYRRNISRLPFSLESASVANVALKEDTSTQRFTNPDDVVDKSLFNLVDNN